MCITINIVDLNTPEELAMQTHDGENNNYKKV